MIQVDSLTKKFGKFTAVDNLSFEVEKGEIFGFVGANGAGKSTTIKIATGLLQPSSGTIYIAGEDVSKKKSNFKRKIGYVPDFFGVYDDLKVVEYMTFYCNIHKIPKNQQTIIIDKLLELVNLSNKKDDFVDKLSRGMKQRLCLARALVHNPELLILDEPASGLDPRARVEFRNILLKLKDMGKTILISSHILSELAEICTTIGIIDEGKLVVKGTVNEIQQKLSHLNRITIKTNSSYDDLQTKLKELPSINDINFVDGHVELSFSGSDEEKHVLLKNLVNSGHKIYHFEEKGGSLESIFLQVTKEEENND